MSLKFTILGCGSSMGVPRPDGNFGKCNPKNIKNYRTRCSAILQTKTDNILYSALRNAIAPSAIFFAILPIFSEPTSLEATQLVFKSTNRSASIPALGMK